MSIRLPHRVSEAPVRPDASSVDGSTLKPLDEPTATAYMTLAASSRASAVTANAIATRLEMGLPAGATVTRPVPLAFEADWRCRPVAVRARREALAGARQGWQNPGGRDRARWR